jgi:ubiquinone/menaquinone biosynthesis C-methylase UbiE
MNRNDKYIPALSYDRLTPLFDPVLRRTMRELELKRRLIDQARIEPGQRVLDLGCGTATLAILIKQIHPDAIVVGLDGDPKILAIAEAKAAKAGVDLTLDRGLAFEMPYPDQSFDRVVSSLVIHHLITENKRRAFKEVYRVLRPGGELNVLDFGRPHNFYTSIVSLLIRRLEEATDNVQGSLPAMIRDTGFDQVEVTQRFTTIFGSLSLYQASQTGRVQSLHDL